MRTLSENTVKKLHANIHKALDEAVLDGLISYNPSEGIKFSNSPLSLLDFLRKIRHLKEISIQLKK